MKIEFENIFSQITIVTILWSPLLSVQIFVYNSIQILLHHESVSLSVALGPHRLQCYSKLYAKVRIVTQGDLPIITRSIKMTVT